MIQPINQNLNIRNLSPVEIPHFKGGARVIKNSAKADSFKKAAVEAKKINPSNTPKNSKMTSSDIIDATKKGLKKGANIVKKGAGVCFEFISHLVKSLYKDSVGFVKEKGAKTISKINDVI